MQSVLPCTVQPQQMMGCEKMKLLNPNSAAVTGPVVTAREPRRIVGGLLTSWDAEAAAGFLAPACGVETWNLDWTEHEAYWEDNVERCGCPEEVEDLLPSKWIGYRVETDVDQTLAHVCKLCTALVDRYIELSSGNAAVASTAKWRQRQVLHDRLGAVLELIEASIGEAVALPRLRDPDFIRQCWEQLQEEERVDVLAVLGAE